MKQETKSRIIAGIGGVIALNVIMPALNPYTILATFVLLIYIYVRKRQDLKNWMKNINTIELAMFLMATYFFALWGAINFIRFLYMVFH